MSEPDLIDRYAASYFTLNSISERRKAASLGPLRRYEASLGGLAIEEAGDIELRQHLVALMREGMLASTVNFHLRTITPFYGWLWQERLIDADRLLRIREVSPPRGWNNHKPRPYSRKEILQLWVDLDARWPRLPAETGDGRNDKIARYRRGTSPFRSIKKHVMHVQVELMVELALVCGLRRQEIYDLSIDNLHPDNAYIVVKAKRQDQHDKFREVPFPDSTRNLAREWCRLRGFMGATSQSAWLSVTHKDPLGPFTWRRMECLLDCRSTGGRRWDWHRLRHTCATERLRAGMALHELQCFLGHSNLPQTLAYADLVIDDIHRAAAKTDDAFQRAIRPAA